MRFGCLKDVQIGDRLTYNRGHSRPYEFRTVARVLKNAVIDSAGDKWTARGDAWGEGNTPWGRLSSGCIRPYRMQDEQTNRELRKADREKQFREKVGALDWRRLPMQRIMLILAAAEGPLPTKRNNVKPQIPGADSNA